MRAGTRGVGASPPIETCSDSKAATGRLRAPRKPNWRPGEAYLRYTLRISGTTLEYSHSLYGHDYQSPSTMPFPPSCSGPFQSFQFHSVILYAKFSVQTMV